MSASLPHARVPHTSSYLRRSLSPRLFKRPARALTQLRERQRTSKLLGVARALASVSIVNRGENGWDSRMKAGNGSLGANPEMPYLSAPFWQQARTEKKEATAQEPLAYTLSE